MCRVGCSGAVGVTSFCNDVSTVDNWSAGQRTYDLNLWPGTQIGLLTLVITVPPYFKCHLAIVSF